MATQPTPSGIRAVTAQDVLYQLNAQSTAGPIQTQNGLQVPAPMTELINISDTMTCSNVAIINTWGSGNFGTVLIGVA